MTTINLQVSHSLPKHRDVALPEQPARTQYLHFAVAEEHGSSAIASGDLHNVGFIPRYPRATKAAIYDCAITANKHGSLPTRGNLRVPRTRWGEGDAECPLNPLAPRPGAAIAQEDASVASAGGRHRSLEPQCLL